MRLLRAVARPAPRLPGPALSQAGVEPAVVCTLCGAPVPLAERRACGLCAAPHHRDCWEYSGMCSTYGCGGIADVAWSEGLVPALVEVDGRQGAHQLALRTTFESLARRARERAGDLPATLTAGALGAGAATATLVVAWPVLRGSWVLHRIGFWENFVFPYAAVFGVCGLSYGALSPFLAPWAHRRPALVASLTGFSALAVYLGAPRITWNVLGLAGLLGILSAATVGEWVLGPYRPIGRRLGHLATPARDLFVGTFLAAAGLASALARGFHATPTLVTECAIWGILAALGGGYALEVGKEEYRKHLVALVEGPASEAEEADPPRGP